MIINNQQYTINNLVDYLSAIATSHKQIHYFGFGPTWEVAVDKETPNYPLLWVEPRPSVIGTNHVSLKMRLYMIDIVNDDFSNRQDIISDSFQVLMDIKAYIYKDFGMWLLPGADASVEPLWEKFDDKCDGWFMDLELKFDNVSEVCDIPGLYPSGSTFQSSGYFQNINLANYLPLGGGVLTGPLTGTSTWFMNYYSGGTPLETIIYNVASGITPQAQVQYWTTGSTGNFSLKVVNDSGLDVIGDYALAEGYATQAIGDFSHAEGNYSIASGVTSHAEGASTQALGVNSHSEGDSSIASGDTSHAEGNSVAIGLVSHAEGYNTTATGDHSHSEGEGTQATGIASHAEGFYSIANGNFSHAEGQSSQTVGYNSHAEGNNTIANGNNSHVEGDSSIASGDASHAQGYNTTANGDHSHAEGEFTHSDGLASHAEGLNTQAIGNYSHAGGVNSTASGSTSFVHGNNNKSIGNNTAVIGGNNITGAQDNSTYVPTLFVMDALTDNSATNLLVREATGEIRMRALSSVTTTDVDNYLPLSGGTVTGNTYYTAGLSANTITLLSASTNNFITNVLGIDPLTNKIVIKSVTPDNTVTGFTFNNSTYDLTILQNNGLSPLTQNLSILATDMTVTGGTYNSSTGIATFYNNSGGSFSVTGFLTGHTDTYVTGMTFSSNTLTLYQTQGNASVSQVINNFTAGLTATTISATTYQGLPKDVFVTGGTYSSGTTTFGNSTGGTFTVSGFTNPFTGGTVNGPTIFTNGLTANTLSATTAVVGNTGTEGSVITVNNLTFDSSFKISDIDGSNVAQTIFHKHSTTDEPMIIGARSNSDNIGHSAMTAGQNVFTIYGSGTQGSNYKINGQISIATDILGSLSNTSSPGKIDFYTTPNGSIWPELAMSINSQKQMTSYGSIVGTSVSATTISATTYQGLPIDIYITGGTYSNGTAVFGNSTGGTFSVTGMTTPFTGGTVTGATTFTSSVSAATFYNIPESYGIGADGQTGIISTGILGYKVMDFPGIITAWDLILSPSGSCVFDVYKIASSGNTLPTSANTITGGAYAQVSNGVYSGSTNIASWTKIFSPGDIFGYNIISASGATRAVLNIKTLINTQ